MYVLGGRNRVNAARLPDYEGFEAALILRVSDDGTYEATEFEYRAHPDAAPDQNPSSLFKAGHLTGNGMFVCTHAEVLALRLPDFSLTNYISLPSFNDLHHVRTSPQGTLMIANTGLDAVLEVSEIGQVVREWELSGNDLWTRFSKVTDYRKVGSTKPHLVHPNFTFIWEDEVWVTRLKQRDALRLLPSSAQIRIDIEQPHDGIVLGQKVYFTTVDGHLVQADLTTRLRERVFDLQELSRSKLPLGWCRGLKVLETDRVIIGFSRLRPTRLADNIAWMKRRIYDASGVTNATYNFLPTRIACFDLARGKLVWESNLEPFGLNAVYSIL